MALKVIAIWLLLVGVAFGQQNAPDRTAPINAQAVRCVTPDGTAFESCGATLLGGGSSGVDIQDEGGSVLGTAATLNCVGSGIACTFSSGTGTLTVSGANAALSNLASVSINTSLLAQSGVDLGSASAPFRSGFLSATSASAVGTKLNLYKSRSGGVITTADVLGDIDFYGHDGSNALNMARIRAVSTGTIASTRVPTALEFYTATNAAPSVLTKALTLGTDQSATFTGGISQSITSATSTREVIQSYNISDAGDDKGGVANATSTDNIFIPTFWGYVTSIATSASFQLRGLTSSAQDASDSSALGLVDLTAFRTNNSSDPNNGTLSDIVNRKLLSVRTLNLIALTISAKGTVASSVLPNASILTGTDYSITGSGTTSMIDHTGTLNTSGVVDVWKLDLTNTASAAGSSFANFKISGTSKIKLGINGNIDAVTYSAAGTAGLSSTISVRKGDDSAACNIVVTGGLITSTTC